MMLFVVVLSVFAGLGQCQRNYTTAADSQGIISLDYTPYLSEVVYSTASNATGPDVPKFEPRGMQPLYAVTNKFIELVGENLKREIPPGKGMSRSEKVCQSCVFFITKSDFFSAESTGCGYLVA